MPSIFHLFIIIAIYFIPFIFAKKRKHNKTGTIFIANLLFGWTFIGWIAVLVWSLSSNVSLGDHAPKIDLKKQLPEIKCPVCGAMNMANTTCSTCDKNKTIMVSSAKINSATKIVSYARKDPSTGIGGLQGQTSKKYQSQININNN